MGFPTVEVRLPNVEFSQPAIFNRWLAAVGDFVETSMPIASVSVGGIPHALFCNMPVVIHEISTHISGTVAAGDLLCLALAEGDEIPYGRPYARLEKVA